MSIIFSLFRQKYHVARENFTSKSLNICRQIICKPWFLCIKIIITHMLQFIILVVSQ